MRGGGERVPGWFRLSVGDSDTVTPKTVPMFGSFVLHMKWCV